MWLLPLNVFNFFYVDSIYLFLCFYTSIQWRSHFIWVFINWMTSNRNRWCCWTCVRSSTLDAGCDCSEIAAVRSPESVIHSNFFIFIGKIMLLIWKLSIVAFLKVNCCVNSFLKIIYSCFCQVNILRVNYIPPPTTSIPQSIVNLKFQFMRVWSSFLAQSNLAFHFFALEVIHGKDFPKHIEIKVPTMKGSSEWLQ